MSYTTARLRAILRFACLVAAVTPGSGFTAESGGHESEHEFHPNEVAVSIGGAFEGREAGRDKGVWLALEYERRLSKEFGIAVIAEHTWGDLDIWVFAVPFRYHMKRWNFVAGPGVERHDGHTEGLVRLGASYAFPAEKTTYLVGAGVDLVDGEAVFLIGGSIGLGF